MNNDVKFLNDQEKEECFAALKCGGGRRFSISEADAATKLYLSHEPFIWSIIKRLYPSEKEDVYEELFSICKVEFFAHIKEFANLPDDKKIPFPKFIYFRLQRAMRDYINSNVLNITGHYRWSLKKLDEAEAVLLEQGKEVTDKDLAILTGYSAKRIEKAKEYRTMSQHVYIEEMEDGYNMLRGKTVSPEEIILQEEIKQTLSAAIDNILSPEDAFVFRFYIDTWDNSGPAPINKTTRLLNEYGYDTTDQEVKKIVSRCLRLLPEDKALQLLFSGLTKRQKKIREIESNESKFTKDEYSPFMDMFVEDYNEQQSTISMSITKNVEIKF